MDFREAYHRVERRIEERYGVDVRVSDVLDPNTGDFDGSRIAIDYANDEETAFFVLVHLFGHTVQWNVSDEFRRVGLDVTPGKTDAEMAVIEVYERDATRYSIALMHEAGVTDLDRWASDWWVADWKWLSHFYRTGEKVDPKTFLVRDTGDLLTPLPIPEFTPQRWVSRYAF